MTNSSTNAAPPAKIKCKRCCIVKNTAAFSGRQLNDLVTHMSQVRTGKFNPITMPFIACTGCTSRQVTELKCDRCDLTKGLNAFFKNQRKNPDQAVCIACREEIANIEPGANDEDFSGPGSSEDSASDSDDEFAVEMANLSVSGKGPGTYSSHGGVSIVGSATQSTNFDSSSTANASSSRTVSTNTTIKNPPTSNYPGFPSSPDGNAVRKPSAAAKASTSGGGKFAKVKAVHREVKFHHGESKKDDDSDGDDVEIQSD